MNHYKTNPARTVLTITVGFILLYLLSGSAWLMYVALTVGITGVFSSYLSALIDRLWMKLAWLLSFIIPTILLGIVFFLLVFPLSLLSKLFSRADNLMLKNRKSSIFVETRKQFSQASFEKPW